MQTWRADILMPLTALPSAMGLPYGMQNGTRKGSSAAVASLRTTAQTWHTDIRVPCTPSTCAMGLPYGMRSWRPRGIICRGRVALHCDANLAYKHPGALHSIYIRNGLAMLYGMLRWRSQGVIRRGRLASHCDTDLACGHPGALYSSPICAVASLRTAAQTWGADIPVLSFASTFAMRLPKWCPQGIIRRGRLASHCDTDLAYGHPGALHSIHIRSGFAICYPNMAPQTRGRLAAHCGTDVGYGHPGALHNIDIRDGFALRYAKMAPAKGHPPRSLRFALRHRPGIRTSGCPAHHPHAQWVCPTVCQDGARKVSSAAVASLRTAMQTWHTDIRVPCTASKSAMGLPSCTVC